jgi:large subunit ribosomal protein L18
MKTIAERHALRKVRIRRKIYGTEIRPRLAVYRSLKHIYAQIIDDSSGVTLAAASSKEKGFKPSNGVKTAATVGQNLAKRAVGKGIKQVVFDRAARVYTGRIKALADGARESGLEF